MQVVWFKKDLRIEDHAPLYEAIKLGKKLLPLYIIEPEFWAQPDCSLRHYNFLLNCLVSLNHSLQKLGASLTIKVGNTIDVFKNLHENHKIKAIFSHQETGNMWTFERDKNFKRWVQENNIAWVEKQQNGVIRGKHDRNDWGKNWYKTMSLPVVECPNKISSLHELPDKIPSAADLKLHKDICTSTIVGGREEALNLLNSFLGDRGKNYAAEMSSPLTAFDACSRLSPHITFGTLSLKEIFQAVERRKKELNALPEHKRNKWASALRSFSSRLRWHCHFIQKFEDEPDIEFNNMHPAYNGLREKDFNESYFTAWQNGKTGYPMIDACMRSLIHTGWINFRMRAMLISFASYHLWLHWRRPAHYLARLFTDYEPGIHYAQIQMQSGTTGINSIRIYNPIKQGLDHDPEGKFIKKWIPELKNVPTSLIHTPWMAKNLMGGYPLPIVNEKEARQKASGKIYEIRKHKQHKAISKNIVIKHASRKALPKRNVPSKIKMSPYQRELPI